MPKTIHAPKVIQTAEETQKPQKNSSAVIQIYLVIPVERLPLTQKTYHFLMTIRR